MENKKKIKTDELILEKSNMKKRKEEFILFNKMFTGSFNENNIGHEIINCFRTDKGEEYIYILPYGGISKKLNNKVKYIINIGPLINNRFEILSLIEEPEQLYFGGNKGNTNAHKEQIKYIKNNNIKYGGKLLYEIMEDNPQNYKALYYTFKAKRIVKPKSRLFIIQEDIEKLFIDKQNIHIAINVQRSKGKISSIINSNIYDELVKKVIQNKNLWKEKDETQKINLNKFSEDMTDLNFLKVINKEDEETIFTNMFYYFLKENPILANNFIKSVMGLKENVVKIEKEKRQLDYKQNEETNEDKNNISEIRKKHIDLWIETNDSIIAIENKIKSGINGLSDDRKISQLDNYYIYTEWYKEKYAPNKKIYYYIFVPNYNKDLIERVRKKYIYGLNYIIITYKELYDFFNSKEEKDICENNKYYIDFINALYKHIFAKDEELERRFVLKIKQSKE